jgi:hypothetical protein
MVTRVAAGCAAAGGLLFAAFLVGEAEHAADFRDLTANLGWVSAGIAALVGLGLYRDWVLAWAVAVPAGLWLLFIGVAPLVFDEFAGPPTAFLIALAGLGLLACVVLRVNVALQARRRG